MEYYSAIKKNSFESVLMRWMKLEPIIQSEVSQKDKDHCMQILKLLSHQRKPMLGGWARLILKWPEVVSGQSQGIGWVRRSGSKSF